MIPADDSGSADPQHITQWQQALGAQSAEELLPLVYDQLRALARDRLSREKPGQTLQPTALVHEAFLRVAGTTDPGWSGPRHFFAAAAEAMRRILINRARSKATTKRGGDRHRSAFDCDQLGIQMLDDRILEVEEALDVLESADPRAREIVNLRFFTGLTTAETAEALGVSASTVEREWRFIRSFLVDALADDSGNDGLDEIRRGNHR